ncbi:cell division control protein 48 homolog C-like isoform X2 [Salvia miltiorrhiza]|uniref:cell division control protein 48 homolog C-like isoform X2 n=1 Tax=Salvia miltiorrhiza TaxID=226208 RepID=UPI0025AB95DA|nr:cell division control protein 48 homolog C-like isoform X2 [Salvia miltiorrhiza]
MPSSHRETCFSGKKSSMAGERGSAVGPLYPREEQVLRSHIESAVAGRKQFTASATGGAPLLQLPGSITPLSCRRDDAMDEPTRKRQKIDETRNASRQIEVFRAYASASYSDSNGREVDPSKRDESGGDGRKMRDGARRDANGVNGAIVGDLEGVNELGDGKTEMNKNGEGERRDVNIWPLFSDFGGLHMMIDKFREVILPLHQWKLLRHFGAEPMTAVLLHGPRGCGKTALARAFGNEAGVPFFETSAAALMSGVTGTLELFCRAYRKAPSIVFIDEIDALTSEMGSLRPCPVKQLMACMDEPVNDGSDSESSNSGPGYVLMIGATNKPDAIDPALRRRFDREFRIRVPEKYDRRDILSVLTRNLKLEVGFDLSKLAEWTLGFVAGDLVALVKEARKVAVKRAIYNRVFKDKRELGFDVSFRECSRKPFSDEELENLSIAMHHFVEAGMLVHPSAKMEGFSTTPYAKWGDVGGLQFLKLEFERGVVKPIKFPLVYQDLRVYYCDTFFLYGPSGCGKTLIVKALAREAGANFMHIKARELLKFGDQSDTVVQNIFSYANSHPPCIVFFDELDVMTSCGDEDKDKDKDEEEDKDKDKDKDKDNGEGKGEDKGEDDDDDEDGNNWGDWPWPDFRQLVSETGSLSTKKGVYVIGASSRPEIMSHILSIRDYFGAIRYVPLPTPKERGAILKALARGKPIDADVDLMALGKDVACGNFSGDDLSALWGLHDHQRCRFQEGVGESLPVSLIHGSQELGASCEEDGIYALVDIC